MTGASRRGAPGEGGHEGAIRQAVTAFAQAWFLGDEGAMLGLLHPDFIHRCLGVDAADPREALRRAVGIQGTLGVLTPAAGRDMAVRVLEVGRRSASAAADLAFWSVHLHLVRTPAGWRIVNVLWEMGAPRVG